MRQMRMKNSETHMSSVFESHLHKRNARNSVKIMSETTSHRVNRHKKMGESRVKKTRKSNEIWNMCELLTRQHQLNRIASAEITRSKWNMTKQSAHRTKNIYMKIVCEWRKEANEQKRNCAHLIDMKSGILQWADFFHYLLLTDSASPIHVTLCSLCLPLWKWRTDGRAGVCVLGVFERLLLPCRRAYIRAHIRRYVHERNAFNLFYFAVSIPSIDFHCLRNSSFHVFSAFAQKNVRHNCVNVRCSFTWLCVWKGEHTEVNKKRE